MKKPEELAVVIYSTNMDISTTLRMGIRGAGVRTTQIVSTPEQVAQAFTDIKPDAMLVYVGVEENDSGLRMIRFIRRWERSPNPQIPIVAASPRQDVAGITAVRHAGAHEFVLFPASGDELMRKLGAAIQSTREFITSADYVGPCRRRRADPAYAGPERRKVLPAH